MAISYVLEFFKLLQNFGAPLFVSVGSRHFLLPVVTEAFVVILLDGHVLMHLLEMVESRLIMHDTYGIGKEGRRNVRGRFFIFCYWWSQWVVCRLFRLVSVSTI